MMTANELRSKFLKFFESRDHAIISSASLIPENDPTVLFTTAGMHPLVPFLLGQTHPAGKQLTSVQKCIRTGDIDEVGDRTHLTFFEMLGNWSLGAYFKKEAIDYSWEFLTGAEWLNISPERLAVSVFVGDNDAPFDQESYDQWLAKGVAAPRIAKLAKKDNWWGPAGQTGPCGPDTEMFYWVAEMPAPAHFDPEDKGWVEIWNDVFMAYGKQADGSFLELAQKNVDTGMGLERVLCVMNGISDIYQTELFSQAIERLESLSGKKYIDNTKAFRVIVDHIRAAVMIIGDQRGVGPSNVDQGYVVRKLIRRSMAYGWKLGLPDHFIYKIGEIFIDNFKVQYPELLLNRDRIQDEMVKEEAKFIRTLENGEKIIETEVNAINLKNGESITFTEKGFSDVRTFLTPKLDGEWFFNLYQSYGYPFEMAIEECENRGVEFSNDEKEALKSQFEKKLIEHQDLSRTATAGKFKGGLADASEETTKLHTATHLLQAALRKVLGNHIFQKGSNITAERLRFDFSHPDKMTPEQIKEAEDMVNEVIAKALPVTYKEVSLEEARAMGALGVFESKYNDMVKVYTVGSDDDFFSREICGGPHVSNTSELGGFKILKEEASSAGVRRIKAVVGQ